MSKEYDLYLEEHIGNVMKAYKWIRDNLKDFYSKDYNAALFELMKRHDKSKYSPNEYFSYDKYFYGKDLDEIDKKAFDRSWLYHIHNNPHHWQYWVLLEDDPETGELYKCVPMPFIYIIEMVCDWWSFSWKKGDLHEIFGWYEKHKDIMKLHPDTRKIVEDLLEQIYRKLEEKEND